MLRQQHCKAEENTGIRTQRVVKVVQRFLDFQSSKAESESHTPGLLGSDYGGKLIGCQPVPGFILTLLSAILQLDAPGDKNSRHLKMYGIKPE